MTRRPLLFRAGGLSAALAAGLLSSAPAMAQATVNLHALDSPNGTAPPAAPSSAPAPRPTTAKEKPPAHGHKRHESNSRTAAPANPTPAAASHPSPAAAPRAAAPAAPPAVLPGAPPPEVRLSPLETTPKPPETHPEASRSGASSPPVVAPDAGGQVSALPGGGLRMTFEPSRADMSPESETALKSLAATAPKSDTTTFNVLAYAAGSAEDPSTPRRLSLSRALAIRSVLMAEGVPSTHIYVRALGAGPAPGAGGDATAPPDRADVTISGANGAPAPSSAR